MDASTHAMITKGEAGAVRVRWTNDGKVSAVLRNHICMPALPEEFDAGAQVEAQFGRNIYAGVALNAWRHSAATVVEGGGNHADEEGEESASSGNDSEHENLNDNESSLPPPDSTNVVKHEDDESTTPGTPTTMLVATDDHASCYRLKRRAQIDKELAEYKRMKRELIDAQMKTYAHEKSVQIAARPDEVAALKAELNMLREKHQRDINTLKNQQALLSAQVNVIRDDLDNRLDMADTVLEVSIPPDSSSTAGSGGPAQPIITNTVSLSQASTPVSSTMQPLRNFSLITNTAAAVTSILNNKPSMLNGTSTNKNFNVFEDPSFLNLSPLNQTQFRHAYENSLDATELVVKTLRLFFDDHTMAMSSVRGSSRKAQLDPNIIAFLRETCFSRHTTSEREWKTIISRINETCRQKLYRSNKKMQAETSMLHQENNRY